MNHRTLCFRVVALAALPLTAVVARAQSECDQILRDGVRNSYLISSSKDLKQEFDKSFCQSSSGTGGASQGGSFGASLGKYKLDFGGNESSANTVTQQSCDKGSGKLSDDGYLRLMQYTVDAKIVDAWSSCINNQSGAYILGELNDSDLMITYKFRNSGAIASTKATMPPFISGANCPAGVVVAGTDIHGGGITEACTRSGDGPVSIALNTQWGSTRFFIPKKPTLAAGPNKAGQYMLSRGVVAPQPLGQSYCVTDAKVSSGPFQAQRLVCLVPVRSGECVCYDYGPSSPGQPPKIIAGHPGEVAEF